MQITTRMVRHLAAIIVLWAATPLAAETALRWKLAPGERLAVEVEQQTNTDVKTIGREAKTEIHLAMVLEWHVTGVEGDRITLKQSLRRLQFRMESPTGGRVTYDSAERARPIGQARAVADAVAPLLEAELEIVMNDRGEVLETKPINDAAQRLFAAGGDGGGGDAGAAAAAGSPPLTRQSVQQLLRQPLAILPEKPVNPGDTWQREAELDSALGKATQAITYTYAGPQETEDRSESLHKIETTSQLSLPMPPPGARALTLTKHEQTGTILFSTDLGRLVEAEQTQTLQTERPYRETTIAVTLTSRQTTTVKPIAADRQPE